MNEVVEAAETFIPSEPTIPALDHEAVSAFLHREFACPSIQSLYPHMHWVASRDGGHIDALHHNLVKGRQIVVTEDPELHVVWYRKTIWIKPLPRCLFDQGFWESHLAESKSTTDRSSSRRDVIGFMRTYASLIQHESDFLLAQEYRLLPKEDISYLSLRELLEPYRLKPDEAVSLRYHYGQIRLSRLNWATRLFQPSVRHEKGFLGRLYYHQLYWDTSDFIQAYITPFVFVFATLSVILSAMQVVLAAETVDANIWRAFARASWGFSVFVLVTIVGCMGLLVVIVVWIFAAQIIFGSRKQRNLREIQEQRPEEALNTTVMA